MGSKSERRTAVLAVHGIGNQRPMETVRGVFGALWNAPDLAPGEAKRFWTHPEKGVDDIDLMVITTNRLDSFGRAFDFHELYWAHLMSETRAIAVLEWLFGLVRSGPNLKKGMRAFWWVASIYLAFVLLSVTYLGVVFVTRFADIAGDSQILVFQPLILLFVVAVLGTIASLWRGQRRLAKLLSVPVAVGTIALLSRHYLTEYVRISTELFFPLIVSTVAAFTLMGQNGVRALGAAYALSWCIFAVAYPLMATGSALPDQVGSALREQAGLDWAAIQEIAKQLISKHEMPWQINSDWSIAGASAVIISYLVLNALFLEPYLGDAARYFSNSPGNVGARREIRRQAVKTLENLHLSGDYDRIVIVAHSLGTVVAYDMLRAYFSDIARKIPIPTIGSAVDAVFDAADRAPRDSGVLPAQGRVLIEKIAAQVTPEDAQKPEGKRAWLVTDFVTLGSPLTHGAYLLLRGSHDDLLYKSFSERVTQREYPVCPPLKTDGDGLLTFTHPSGDRFFHHGAVFGLTRWTNLYFRLTELFWGDAIGGPVKEDEQKRELFGPGVIDREVSLRANGEADFFTHTAYWDMRGNGPAPHIRALREAANLAEPSPENAGTA